MDDLREAATAAGVIVKPLEWTAIDDASWFGHGFEPCQFYIRREHGSYWLPGDDEEDAAEFATLAEAQSAAQADYETRILAALEPQATSAIASEAPERLWLDVKFRELFLPGEEQYGIEGLVEYRRAALEPQDAPAVAEELVALRAVLEDLRKSAALLQQNAEGCAVNHYGADFAVHGMPGWLADTAASIARATAALTPEAKS